MVESMEKYEIMENGLKIISDEEIRALIDKCQENSWLKIEEIDFDENFNVDDYYPYCFFRTKNLEILKMYFIHGNWAIREGILFKDICFVNQVSGEDEYWILKYDAENNKWINFESVNFRDILRDNEFESFIDRLCKTTIEDCKKLNY